MARIAAPSDTRVLQNVIDSFATLQGRFDPHILGTAVALVGSVHRIDLYGSNSSGVVVLGAQTKFFCYGIPANACSDSYLVSMSLNVLRAGGMVIAISKSGALPELQTAMEYVYELGVRTIAAMTPGSPFVAPVDIVLPADVDDAVADRPMAACLLHPTPFDVLVLEVALHKGSAFQCADQLE